MSAILVNKKYLKRHKKGFIAFHWINAICFFLLFLTGLPLFVTELKPVYDALGPNNMQTIHHIAGVVFFFNPIVALFTARDGIATLFREMFRLDKTDLKFLAMYPGELIGRPMDGMPRQGFFTGGERLNIALQMLIWLLLVCSGFTMWLGGDLIGNEVRAWMIPLHSAAAGIGFAAALGHIYIALVVASDSVQSMKDGTVKASYAEDHHGRWVDDLVRTGKLKQDELDEALRAR